MIEIDGSRGEGGGQMLRTAIALSAVSGRPVKISGIRAKRDNPGLAPQHLAAVKAVAELCGAQVTGLSIGSKELEFVPHETLSGKLNVDVGTAGSITLVLQALLIPAFYAKQGVSIQVRGGTDVRWSPSIDFLRYVTLPLIRKFGFDAGVNILERGYYPRGGGRVVLEVKPAKNVREIALMEPGNIVSVKGISSASISLEARNVAQRQAKAARTFLFNRLSNRGYTGEIAIETEYVQTPSIGSGITLWVETERSVIGADALGGQNTTSEAVGSAAARDIMAEIESGAPLDRYMADQIVPYIALAGGSVRVSEMTGHAATNVGIVNLFGFDVSIDGRTIKAERG